MDYGTADQAGHPAQGDNRPAEETEEMRKVREIFAGILDTMLVASKLSKEVEALRQEVSGLHRDVEYLRSQNKTLDEQIGFVRQQRDQAVEEAARLRGELSDANSKLRNQQASIDDLSAERDLLAEENGQLKAKLEAISQAMQGVYLPPPSDPSIAQRQEEREAEEAARRHWEEQPRTEHGQFDSPERSTDPYRSVF